MDLTSYLLYLSISIFASVSVGPSVILAASNGLNYGLTKSCVGVFGHISAILILALLSASGLGASLLASENVFTLIKYLGVVYLAYIGWSILTSRGKWAIKAVNNPKVRARVLYRKSLMLGLSNPKALVFFTALFPQCINPEKPLLEQFVLMTGTSLFNAFIFTMAYAYLGFKMKNKLLPFLNNGSLGKVTGSLFLGFAATLAFGV